MARRMVIGMWVALKQQQHSNAPRDYGPWPHRIWSQSLAFSQPFIPTYTLASPRNTCQWCGWHSRDKQPKCQARVSLSSPGSLNSFVIISTFSTIVLLLYFSCHGYRTKSKMASLQNLRKKHHIILAGIDSLFATSFLNPGKGALCLVTQANV